MTFRLVCINRDPRQHFDGDLALVLQILGEVDGRHAAAPYFPLDLVAVGEGGHEPSGDLIHEQLRWGTTPALGSPALRGRARPSTAS